MERGCTIAQMLMTDSGRVETLVEEKWFLFRLFLGALFNWLDSGDTPMSLC
jgi:hypothetical protein